MPGIAQIVFSEDELDALIESVPFGWTTNPSLPAAFQKLKKARDPLACPISTKEERA